MPLLGADDPLPLTPARVIVSGTSGSGKTTLCAAIAAALDLPPTELDGLHHGPGWVPREEFVVDVGVLAASPRWVTEWQYQAVRPTLLDRCDLAVHLDLPRAVVMSRVIRRTVRRSVGRMEWWNGNREPGLHTFFTDRDHIVRWAWRTHGRGAERLAEIRSARPDLTVVVLRSPAEVRRWVDGLPRARRAGGTPGPCARDRSDGARIGIRPGLYVRFP